MIDESGKGYAPLQGDGNILAEIRRQGFDGVFMPWEEALTAKGEMGGDAILVFSPTQIKSATANRGTWDPEDPDIRRNPGPDLYDPVGMFKRKAKPVDPYKRQRVIENRARLIRHGFPAEIESPSYGRLTVLGMPKTDPSGSGLIIIDDPTLEEFDKAGGQVMAVNSRGREFIALLSDNFWIV